MYSNTVMPVLEPLLAVKYTSPREEMPTISDTWHILLPAVAMVDSFFFYQQ
jgi:hypothetical protein